MNYDVILLIRNKALLIPAGNSKAIQVLQSHIIIIQ